MPRQRIHHSRIPSVFPGDFPERLELFKEESCLSWAELAHHLGTYPDNVRRWRAGVRPSVGHLMALLSLSDTLGLSHLLTAQRAGGTTNSGPSGWDSPVAARPHTRPMHPPASNAHRNTTEFNSAPEEVRT